MAMSRGEWIAMEIRRRLGGRRRMDRVLRQRYEDKIGVPFATTPYRGLTEILVGRMIETNRQQDVSLAPYTDKYAVREYVARKVGPEALVPLVWSGRDIRHIPLDPASLPAVLKTNHMSQKVLVVTADTPAALVRRKAARWLLERYYYEGGEYQYQAIRPRVLLETFLDDGTEHGPRDYSFWCIHGEPFFIEVRDGSRVLQQSYDMQWRELVLLPPGERVLDIPTPPALEQMTAMAKALSEPFSFVRVDLYDVHSHPYFGELTFTPAGGYSRFATRALNDFFGDLIRGGPEGVRGAAGAAAHARMAELAAEAAEQVAAQAQAQTATHAAAAQAQAARQAAAASTASASQSG